MSDLIVSIINLLTDTYLLEVPLFVWLLIPLVLYAVISFLKGKSE